jgi:dolichol-phosphate mannosyltransferase
MSPSVEKTLVITPTFRERESLPEFLDRFQAATAGTETHLLVIDDASGDGTPEWLRARPEFGWTLFLVERPGKLGLGTAYLDGFRWALAKDYAYVFQIDADLSHDPAALGPLRARLAAGDDVALGSRYLGGVRILNWPISRLLLSLAAALYARALTGLPVTDPTSGFKGFRRRVLAALDLGAIRSSGYAFQIEVLFQAWWEGFRIGELPIVFADRQAGSSKMSHRIALEALLEVPRLALRRLGPRPQPPEPNPGAARRA